MSNNKLSNNNNNNYFDNYFNDKLPRVPTICINLNIRKDKKKYMVSQAKRLDFRLSFHTVKLHKNPKRGCLESHLNIIKDAIKNGLKQILILEDDAKFIKPLKSLPIPPNNWDMLYLGGTVKSIYEKSNSPWVKMSCWTTHAYILNLENVSMVNDILAMESFGGEVDSYYIKFIHSKYNAYMVNPMMVIQREGYSDIEKTVVNYDFMQDSLNGLRKPQHEIVNGQYSLKLPPISDEDLPMVSIVTPTFERRDLFAIAIWNFEGFYYPKEKLEWVIIDDSIDEMKMIEDLLPKDSRIKYYHYDVKSPMTIANKRNLGVEKASHSIIVHMDDDDFYPGESVLARVKCLIKYQPEGIQCIGCSKIGIYDIIHNASSFSTDGDMSLSEASMAYFKSFWEERQFNEIDIKGEYRSFIYDRYDKILDIPYSFVIIALSHQTNFTEKNREVKENMLQDSQSDKSMNFFDTWSSDSQQFVLSLASFLKKKAIMRANLENVSDV
jgi:hypothetical protein